MLFHMKCFKHKISCMKGTRGMIHRSERSPLMGERKPVDIHCSHCMYLADKKSFRFT